MAFKLEAYVRKASTLVDEELTPIEVAGPKGSIELHKRNILDINKQVAVCIKDGTKDKKGNLFQRWIACSVPLSADIRKRFKEGASVQSIIDSVAGLRIMQKENGNHVLVLPSEAQMFGLKSEDINVVAYERSDDFAPEDLVHL
jgi:hypothetical protein